MRIYPYNPIVKIVYFNNVDVAKVANFTMGDYGGNYMSFADQTEISFLST